MKSFVPKGHKSRLMGGSTPLRTIKIAIIMSIFKEPLNQSATLTDLPEGEPRAFAKFKQLAKFCFASGRKKFIPSFRPAVGTLPCRRTDRKSTRLNSSHA